VSIPGDGNMLKLRQAVSRKSHAFPTPGNM
jgi:hypothetical protein